MSAYYNEIDPFAAQTLRNLIEAGHIAPGFVDERSIEDVKPDDIMGYTQCHFFAGIGIWSLALRNAGWPDDRPVWTGSCPCQPFSTAGKGSGFNDERHLWPSLQWLIKQCEPSNIFGEQVASKDAEPWIDLVQFDLEALGYAFGCVAFPSAGVGAPHIRDRAYWVANANSEPAGRHSGSAHSQKASNGQDYGDGNGFSNARELHANGMADTEHLGHGGSQANTPEQGGNGANIRLLDRGHPASERQPPTGSTNGFWRDADWLHCRDGKWRPVEPGTFPLANGNPSRVGRLRAYGNAINAEAARIFIESVMEIT